MSISENKNENSMKRALVIYAGVSLFCIVFFLVYDRFSHGVRSPYMTWLFLWPLCLGLLPGLALWRFPRLWRQGPLSANLYHPGVAALTVSSLLRGIFEIAGTASVYQKGLTLIGIILLAGGIIAYFARK